MKTGLFTFLRKYAITAICIALTACQSTSEEKKSYSPAAHTLNPTEEKLIGLWEEHSSQVSYVILRKPDGTFEEKFISKWNVDNNNKPVVKTYSGRWSVEGAKEKVPFKNHQEGAVGMQLLKIDADQFLHYSSDYCMTIETRVHGDPTRKFKDVKLFFNESQWDTPDGQAPVTSFVWYVMKYNP